jgi:cold-inducible RNA-binding protein
MTKRLFVGGLPYSITEEELKDMFAKIGAVSSCSLITDKFTNQSKGFAFVEMEKDEDADKAMSSLDGTDVGGRKIVVNVAKPREERSSGGGFGGGRRDFNGGGRRDFNRGGGGRGDFNRNRN